MPINIPNLLTLLRILLIPAILILHSFGFIKASFVILCLGLLTDFFDGHLARKLGQETDFGAIFDPIADKFVALGFYGYILANDLAPWWLLTIILIRNFSQLMCIPILIWWLKKSFKVKPTMFAKWVTAISDIFIFVPLYFSSFLPTIEILLVVLAIAEFYIFITYVPRLYQIATDKHDTFT